MECVLYRYKTHEGEDYLDLTGDLDVFRGLVMWYTFNRHKFDVLSKIFVPDSRITYAAGGKNIIRITGIKLEHMMAVLRKVQRHGMIFAVMPS